METRERPQEMPPGAFARLVHPLREMLTPALTALLVFQILSGILVAPMFSLFPVYVEAELQLRAAFTGNLRALFVVLGGFVAFFGGALIDALGRKPAYLLAMVGVVAAGFLFLVRVPALLWPLTVVAGLLFGLGSVAGQTYLMDVVARPSLGLATACFFMSGTAGNAIGAAAAGRIAKLPDGYFLLGILMAGGELLLLALAARLLPAISRPEVPRGFAAVAGGYLQLFLRRDVWLLLMLRFLPTVYWGTVTLLMPLLLFRLTGSPAPAGDYVAVSMLVAAVCQLAAGRLVDRRGPRGPVLLAVSTVTVAALMKGLLAEYVWAVVLFGILGAGAAWALSITMTTLVQELSTEETKARLLGITHMAWSGGFVTGTLLTGYLASVPGRGPLAFYVSAGCCALAAAAAAVLVGRARAGGTEPGI